MSKDEDMADLNEHWEDDADDSTSTETEVQRVKPVESKDARRRLDDMLEKNRLKRQIEDDF